MKPIIHIRGSVFVQNLTGQQVRQLREQLDFSYRVREQSGGQARYHAVTYPVVHNIGDGWFEIPYGSFHVLARLLGDAADYRFKTNWFHLTVLEHEYPGVQAQIAVPVGMPENRTSQDTALTAIYAAHQRKQFATCIIAPCGAGKTHLAILLIAAIKQPTLIVVHTYDLLKQWVERLEQAFPGVPIGTITDGKVKPGFLSVATVQTLVKTIDQVQRTFAVVILDEAHHCPAMTFDMVMNELPATIKVGLTASKKRRDEMHPLMVATLGPIITEISQEELTDEGVVMAPEIKWLTSTYQTDLNPTKYYTRIIGDLTADLERNSLLLDAVRGLIAQGRHVLFVSGRLAQLEWMAQQLGEQAQLLTGPVGKKKRTAAKAAMVAGYPVTLATLQIGKEGLDAPVLDALVWGTPVRDLVTIQQTVGRIQRSHPGKPTPLVVDTVDSSVGVFVSQAKSRATIYRKLQEGSR